MNNEFLTELLKAILIVIIPLVSGFIVKFLAAKFGEIESNVENDSISFYLKIIENIVIEAIKYTNQTFVDILKSEGKFDAEAQEEAFNKTKTVILSLLTDGMKKVISQLYGDINVWIDTVIEAKIPDVKAGKV